MYNSQGNRQNGMIKILCKSKRKFKGRNKGIKKDMEQRKLIVK